MWLLYFLPWEYPTDLKQPQNVSSKITTHFIWKLSTTYDTLFSGIKSGSAKVSVRLDSKATYATAVPATEVSVLVVANLYLVPQVAYVIFGGTVNYHAEQIKANKVSFCFIIYCRV